MAPDINYLAWLCNRMKIEQPFILFQAGTALINLSRVYGTTHKAELVQKISAALDQLKSFNGTPDRNTIDALRQALFDLGVAPDSP